MHDFKAHFAAQIAARTEADGVAPTTLFYLKRDNSKHAQILKCPIEAIEEGGFLHQFLSGFVYSAPITGAIPEYSHSGLVQST